MSENNFVITTFYKFVKIENPDLVVDEIKDLLLKNEVKGTVLIANEGINSTIAGTRDGVSNFYKYCNSNELFSDIFFKESFCSFIPFGKLKVKHRKEIVSFDYQVDSYQKGNQVPPQEWDKFIERDDVILVDSRNDYEYDIGTFKGAINPNIKTFRQFYDWLKDRKEEFKEKKIASFCTGGVRCEKLQQKMIEDGFEFYQLEGGIINYFNQTRNQNNKWLGGCFVFDDRFVVDSDMESK